MGAKYSHFTLDERCRLRGMIEMGLGPGEIARRLGRHRGTIHREIARNRCALGYRPDSADRMAWVRKLRGPKIQRSTRLRDYVGDRLAMGWSPEEIAGRMELDEMNDPVSAEFIYRYVYSPAGRRAGLPRYLAQRKAKRGRRRRNGRREPSIPNRVSIDQRPVEAEGRIAFGHWEGDLMHFRRQQDILLTLQERCSRLTLADRAGNDTVSRTRSGCCGKRHSLLPPTPRRRPARRRDDRLRDSGVAGALFRLRGRGRGVAVPVPGIGPSRQDRPESARHGPAHTAEELEGHDRKGLAEAGRRQEAPRVPGLPLRPGRAAPTRTWTPISSIATRSRRWCSTA